MMDRRTTIVELSIRGHYFADTSAANYLAVMYVTLSSLDYCRDTINGFICDTNQNVLCRDLPMYQNLQKKRK